MANNPINRDALKKLLDTVTPMSPEVAERFVRELLRIGDERRKNAERLVGEVSAAGRRSAEHFASSVQQEVAKQLGRLVQRIDTLERQLEHVNRNLENTRTAVAAAASKAVARARPTGATTTSSKTGKKASAKNGGSKKVATKKTATKKTATKKTATKKASGKSGNTASKKAGVGKNGAAKGSKKKSASSAAPGSSASAATSVG